MTYTPRLLSRWQVGLATHETVQQQVDWEDQYRAADEEDRGGGGHPDAVGSQGRGQPDECGDGRPSPAS